MVQVQQEKKTVRIGDYVITGKIGQGGVAEIYRARQESLDRDVAIKVLSSKLSNDQDIVRRFERESLVIGHLNHPNIVHVIDRGQAGGRYYFVMLGKQSKYGYLDGWCISDCFEAIFQQWCYREQRVIVLRQCSHTRVGRYQNHPLCWPSRRQFHRNTTAETAPHDDDSLVFSGDMVIEAETVGDQSRFRRAAAAPPIPPVIHQVQRVVREQLLKLW